MSLDSVRNHAASSGPIMCRMTVHTSFQQTSDTFNVIVQTDKLLLNQPADAMQTNIVNRIIYKKITCLQ